jgi:hypothetical protein
MRSPYYLLLHKSLSSVCEFVYAYLPPLLGNGSVNCIPHSVARQRFSKEMPMVTSTSKNRRTSGRIVFYGVPVLPNDRVWAVYSPVVAGQQLGNGVAVGKKSFGGFVFSLLNVGI